MIRPGRASDCLPISRLYRDSVLGIGGRYYSPEQTAAWAALAPDPERLQALMDDGRHRLVGVDSQDRPVCFIDLKPDGHIHFFYSAPEVAGTGLAQALFDDMLVCARNAGILSLHTEASEAARRFFLRNGFTLLERRNLMIGAGVAIHNYAMALDLSGPTG